jgi:hypothetical protein
MAGLLHNRYIGFTSPSLDAPYANPRSDQAPSGTHERDVGGCHDSRTFVHHVRGYVIIFRQLHDLPGGKHFEAAGRWLPG